MGRSFVAGGAVRVLRIGATLASCAVLVGCSLPKIGVEHLDEIPMEKITEIDAVPEIAPNAPGAVPYEFVTDVVGISCRRASRAMPPSWEDAVRRAKYRAMQAGANAVTNLSCDLPRKRTLDTMCLESIRCTARAIRLAK